MDTNNKFKIFLVDDDLFCTSIYLQHLQNLGYTDITTFENGADCLNLLTQQPEVIFLDHGMATMPGLEVLKKIKRFSPDIYVIFLSGQENIETAVSALKYGAFDYIVKGSAELDKITNVMTKIIAVKQILNRPKRSFFNKIMASFI